MLTEFNINTPYPSDPFEDIYTNVRGVKEQFEERFELEHYIGSSQDTTVAGADGQHKQITLNVLTTEPSTITNDSTLYAYKIGDYTELCLMNQYRTPLTYRGASLFTNFVLLDTSLYKPSSKTIYHNGSFYGASTYSPDGTTWSPTNLTSTCTSFCRGSDRFLAGVVSGTFYKGYLYQSTDGITWSLITNPIGESTISSLCYNNGLYLLGGNSGQMYWSENLTAWFNPSTVFGTSLIKKIIYGNNLYVAGAYDNKLATSPDGKVWTLRTTPFASTNSINAIAYGNSTYVIGTSDRIATSPDGVTWTERTSPAPAGSTFNVIEFFNGKFITGTHLGDIYTSPDGITWTYRGRPMGSQIGNIAYGNGLYIFTFSTYPTPTSYIRRLI